MGVPLLEIRPQEGPQEAFLSSPADIVIYGGQAGGGKSFGLLLEPVRHVGNPNFGGVIFRRTSPEITNEGGLWDECAEIYPLLGAVPRKSPHLEWNFPSGMRVQLAHMQHAKDRFAWTGAQIPFIGFDQLEGFEEIQFWYMLSRNRSARAGIKPYIRATCNPVPDDDEVGGWLNKLIAWWWDPATGYPIEERSGVIRWFVRFEEKIEWGDSPQELERRFPGEEPKSLTFIKAELDDNPALTKKDPGYRTNLMALPRVERERLLHGNWKIKATAGMVFDRSWFDIIPAMPTDILAWVRYWDKAATKLGGKYSAGVLMGYRRCKRWIIADVVRGQWSSNDREKVLKQKSQIDGPFVSVWVEQEPGSGGKESAENTVVNLAGVNVRAERVTGDKVTRAGPLSAQAEARNVDLLLGPWNEAFLVEAQNFDGEHGFSDQIDAASGAFNKLTGSASGALEAGVYSLEKTADQRHAYGTDVEVDEDEEDEGGRQPSDDLSFKRGRRHRVGYTPR